jgi:hypothetical protein
LLFEEPSAASEKKRLSHWAHADPAIQKRTTDASQFEKRIGLDLRGFGRVKLGIPR